MARYYLRIHAVNLSYSIYDTYDISTIRGGSSLILDAFEQIQERARNKTLPVEVLSSAASEAVLAFQAENEQSAQAIVQQCLDALSFEAKRIATFVHAWLPVDDEKPGTFQRCLKRLDAICRRRQYQQFSFTLPAVDSGASRACNKDGVRPAVHPEGKDMLSESVRIRREDGKARRQQLYRKILGPDSRPVRMVDDLNELAGDSSKGVLSGKMAYVSLDGNRFGSIRNIVCRTPQALQRFQAYLHDRIRVPALSEMLTFALKDENVSFRTQDGKIRLETLLWGGDEIEWVVPAWQAFNVLRTFLEAIADAREYLYDESGSSVSLSFAVGLVFCRNKLPILKVREYAGQLCHAVKAQLKDEGRIRVEQLDETANRVAFLNMSAFDLVKGDFSSFLNEYHQPADPSEFILPIQDLLDMEASLKTVKILFPRTKLYQITDALRKGQDGQIDELVKQVYQMLPEHEAELDRALSTVLQGKIYRWLVIADLIDYVGEDL